MLIVDDNIYYTKHLINCINNNFVDVNLATNGKETLNLIKKKSFDLILLDLNLPDINGISIIKEIEGLNLYVEPKIIIISGDIRLIDELKKNYFVINVINKSEDFELTCKKIQTYIKQVEVYKNKPLIKSSIVKELSYIGYNFKHKGTRYILEAILYAYECVDFDYSNNLEKYIYKHIAYKYKTSINNIKTNIIRATNQAYASQSENIINSYFDMEIKMKPKDVINKILTKINI